MEPLRHAELEIDSDLERIVDVREFIKDFVHHHVSPKLGEKQFTELQLALNEAVVNVIKHAYSGEGGQRIVLEADDYSDRVIVRLSHWGETFDPDAMPEPSFDGSRDGGFGLFIIKHTVDQVQYFQDDNGKNCICLIKKRT